MRKCLAIIVCFALLLATAGCHFHRSSYHAGHPHGMPPGQAKKIVKPGITPLKVKVHKHHGKPWK